MTDFTTYTDRELVDNMLDRAAGLSWRLDAETELAKRGYDTRDASGHLKSEDALLGAIRLAEMKAAR